MQQIEKQWSVKGQQAVASYSAHNALYRALTGRAAVEQMATYWSILEKVRGSQLKLTKMDDEILEHFKKDFPDFDVRATINEDEMKSKAGKERWRQFMMEYENKVADYNFGTIIRSNPKFEYGEKETIFGKLYLTV